MDPAEEFPNLVASRLNPRIFAPYIKSGRFKPNEPEDLAKAFINTQTWAAAGLWAGLPLAYLALRWKSKRDRKPPRLLLSIIAYPLSSFFFFQAGYKISGVAAATKWASAHPEYTTSEVMDKVALYQAVSIYARDPNAVRPPVHADTGRFEPPNEKKSEERIASEFRKGSPFKKTGE